MSAWDRDPAGVTRPLIVVRIEDCGLDPLLLMAPRVDLFDRDEPDAQSHFLTVVREVVAGVRRLPARGTATVADVDYYSQEERHQFFVSRDTVDDPWATWITWNLEEAGYTVIFESFDHVAGQHSVAWLSGALRWSDRTIVVASPSFVRSARCEAEWRARAAMGADGVRDGILVVRVEECVLPNGLLSAPRVDLFLSESEVAGREQLFGFVRSLGLEPAARPRNG